MVNRMRWPLLFILSTIVLMVAAVISVVVCFGVPNLPRPSLSPLPRIDGSDEARFYRSLHIACQELTPEETREFEKAVAILEQRTQPDSQELQADIDARIRGFMHDKTVAEIVAEATQ